MSARAQDYGWNQAHAVGAKALREIPGVKVVEEENVPETVAVRKTMESMINIDGASLLFPTSFGYFNPFMVDEAKKYPKIEFRHPTSLWSEGKHPTNAGGYFCYLDQGHYVNGIAAGPSTKSNKIGYIAAKPIPLVLRNVNSFMLGARKVNPERHRAADRHRRLGDAGARGGSGQRAGRCRLRRHRLPHRQPQGGDRDRREARRQELRPQRQPGGSRAQGLHHRRRTEVGHDLQASSPA